jgi:transglutaminase-like putative cysteine protease
MFRMDVSLAALTAALTVSGLAHSQTQDSPDVAWRLEQQTQEHIIEADGTEQATFTLATKILRESALEDLKQTSVSYSKSSQTLEILEAYTRKPDGRRLDVPKSNFQVHTEGGQDGSSPIFSDYNSTSVVFPEVAVGDTVVISYKLTTTQAWFPGKISLMGTYPRNVPYGDVKVTIDAPVSMNARFKSRGMAETVSVKDGRQRIEWSYTNKQPVKSERTDFSVYRVESEPGYLYSSFASYAEVARSYIDRASAKAAVTPRIQKLADELTLGQTDAAQQARALYEWVNQNITYAGNCVGLGAIVPRDLDVVLDNKMGDCKDHATLFQALLAAKAIPSEQALINATNIYELPEVPIASLVNHVINYLPSLDTFVDSTDTGMPFGMLGLSVQDKPVLMAASGNMPARTPAGKRGTNRQVMKTKLVIHEDGSADGHVVVSEFGMFAVAARRSLKDMSADDVEKAVKNYFRGMQLEAEGVFTRGDVTSMSDHYEFEATFKVSNLIAYPGSGAFYVTPLFFNMAPVAHFAQQAAMPMGDFDGASSSGYTQEEFEITLPKKLSVLSLPSATAFNSPAVSYESSYRVQGRVLKVRRTLDDKSPGNVCPAAFLKEYKAALLPVWKNIRQQVLYK